MKTSLKLDKGKRWFWAAIIGLALLVAAVTAPLLDPHHDSVAAEAPPALAGPEIGIGGGGNG